MAAPEKESKKIVIIISGEPGAGSTTISKEIADRLGLDFFSPGKMHKKISGRKAESEAALKAWSTEEGRSNRFHIDLDRRQTEVAKKGNVVICGKLSIHFLKKFATFAVWLDVPAEVRAKRTAGRDGIDYEDALKMITNREAIERKEFERIYGFDYVTQKNDANLVLDTSEMSIDGAVEKILEKMKERKRI